MVSAKSPRDLYKDNSDTLFYFKPSIVLWEKTHQLPQHCLPRIIYVSWGIVLKTVK